MSSGAVCGYSGSTSLGGEILEWTLNSKQAIIEATNMDGASSNGGYKEFISCLKEADGSFTSNTPVGVPGSYASVDFINLKHTYTLNLIITSAAKKVVVNDKIGYTYNWISNGEVTIA